MSRLSDLFQQSAERKLLAVFLTAGYPTLDQSVELAAAASDAGADIIEMGMPFSDPLADGPAIQFSSFESLRNGFRYGQLLDGIRALRSRIDTPIVLMGYVNPILAKGAERFCREVAQAGADGLIIPDLPVEEAGWLRSSAADSNLGMTFLTAPTSTRDRVRLIDEASTDFVYAVSVAGVTGARTSFGGQTHQYLQRLAKQLRKPFLVGFGISNPVTAQEMAKPGRGVVIGSALVDIVRTSTSSGNARLAIGQFVGSIRSALDELTGAV